MYTIGSSNTPIAYITPIAHPHPFPPARPAAIPATRAGDPTHLSPAPIRPPLGNMLNSSNRPPSSTQLPTPKIVRGPQQHRFPTVTAPIFSIPSSIAYPSKAASTPILESSPMLSKSKLLAQSLAR